MNKELIQKHLLTGICVIAIIALLLPVVTVSTESEYVSNSKSISVFAVLFKSVGFLLLVGPALLISMNYVKQLDKYKGILAIIVPIVCIITLVITFFQAKAGASAGTDAANAVMGGAGVDMGLKASATPGIGGILALLSYIAMEIVGIKTYKTISLKSISINKDSLNALKNAGAGLWGSAQAKISDAAHNVSDAAHNVSGTISSKVSAMSSAKSLSHTDDILALIEKLAKMKADGILTEEEFTEKKRKLLEEI